MVFVYQKQLDNIHISVINQAITEKEIDETAVTENVVTPAGKTVRFLGLEITIKKIARNTK